MFLKFLLASFFVTSFVFANYSWIPKYQNLRLRVGGEYYKSAENFTEDGERAKFTYLSREVEFSEYTFNLQTEYGFAENWSGGIKLPFRNSFINGTTAGYDSTYLSALGLGDTAISVKWLVLSGDTRLAIESINTIPFYSTNTLNADEMVLGDGTFTSGFKLHGGHLMNGKYSFSLSPGIIFRFKNYSSQFSFESAFGIAIKPVYFRVFSDLLLSLSGDTLATGIYSNPAVGSGGSFAKLSTAPNLWTLGLLGGVFFYEQYRLELSLSQSITGNRAPNGYRFEIAFATSFDFFDPEKKIQVKELPLDAEPTPERGD